VGQELSSANTGNGSGGRRPLLAGGLLVGANLADVVAIWPLASVDHFVVMTRSAMHQVDITGWVWAHMAIGTSVVVAGLLVMSYDRRWVRPFAVGCAVLAIAVGLAILPYAPIRAAFVISADAVAIRLLVRHRSRVPG